METTPWLGANLRSKVVYVSVELSGGLHRCFFLQYPNSENLYLPLVLFSTCPSCTIYVLKPLWKTIERSKNSQQVRLTQIGFRSAANFLFIFGLASTRVNTLPWTTNEVEFSSSSTFSAKDCSRPQTLAHMSNELSVLGTLARLWSLCERSMTAIALIYPLFSLSTHFALIEPVDRKYDHEPPKCRHPVPASAVLGITVSRLSHFGTDLQFHC